MGITWFPDLTDKCKLIDKLLCACINPSCHCVGKSIKVHMYWAMKNCDGSPEKLRSLVMAIPRHYQVLHFAWLP